MPVLASMTMPAYFGSACAVPTDVAVMNAAARVNATNLTKDVAPALRESAPNRLFNTAELFNRIFLFRSDAPRPSAPGRNFIGMALPSGL
ncbi:exported hypothetical protein [Agrobacterium fabacearum TT111]|nr:exported hypothetical protein [Agrobacterium fabacearum TT111]